MGQRIIKLLAENVKRIEAIDITPSGALVVIGGENGAGKSSTLDAIEYALHGKGSHPAEPIRNGAKKARVVVETEDYKVIRRFTKKGTQLVVEGKGGTVYKSPQKLLDKLAGDFCFDPLAFAEMEPRAQLVLMKRLVGLDFTETDAKRKGLYDERTAVNREAKNLRAQFEATPPEEGLPDEEISLTDLVDEMERRREVNRENEEVRGGVTDLLDSLAKIDREVLGYQEQLRELEAKAKNISVRRADVAKELEEQAVFADSLEDLDLEEIKIRGRDAEATNERIRERRRILGLEKQAEDKEAEADEFSARIKAIDNDKEVALGGANFPVEGLGFSEDGITFNGLPLEQASSAERLRISVALGIKLNPDFKVMLIRDGSLLDEKNLRMVAEMAEAAEAQVWLERVSEGPECQVVIADGRVKE